MRYRGPNRYAGSCEACKRRVYAGAGALYQGETGRYILSHKAGRCLAAVVDVPHGLCDLCGRAGCLAIEGEHGVCALGCDGPAVFQPRYEAPRPAPRPAQVSSNPWPDVI